MLHTDWQVDSVNGSVPKGRYKRGYVMYRRPGLQQCIVNSFSFEQSYMGWKAANQEQREKLVQVWVVKGLLAFVTVLHKQNEDSQNRSFQPPQVVSKEGGEISITLWLRMPSGRVRGRSYILREYKFSKDGGFVGSAKLEDFTVLKNGAPE